MKSETISDRPPAASLRSVPHYDRAAAQAAELYESTTFERVHEGALDLLPMPGSAILDVGAGSGRDAAALSRLGYRVTAVEPSSGLRSEALRRHCDQAIEWCDDALPHLRTLGSHRFAFILVSAVWMHLVYGDRPVAMRRLAELLDPGGRLLISIRQGPAEPERAIAPVSIHEVEAAGTDSGLRVIRQIKTSDTLARADVAWSSLVFERPRP